MPLFEGILSDLFPGVELPALDYEQLRAACKANAEKMGLQFLDTFFAKIVQLCAPALLHRTPLTYCSVLMVPHSPEG